MNPRNIQWGKLGYYVYAYVDPRDDTIFYIGKGNGSRVISHLTDKQNTEKTRKIDQIRKLGLEPKIEFLRFGIETDSEAKAIEASCIDAVGVDKLTNEIKGNGSRSRGRKSLEEVTAIVSSQDAVIEDPVLIIRVPKTFFYGIKPLHLYEITRGTWNRLPKGYKNAKYALPIHDGIIQEVYEIAGWFDAMSTQYFTRTLENDDKRKEFVGRIANEEVRNRYLYKSIQNSIPRSYGDSITGMNLVMPLVVHA